MRVQMLVSKPLSLDGSSIEMVEKGAVLDIRDALAERLVARGLAKAAKAVAAAPKEPSPQPDAQSDDASDPTGADPSDDSNEADAPPEADAGSEPLPSLEELVELDRKALNEAASVAGVPEPAKLQNKRAVAEAILAARAAEEARPA